MKHASTITVPHTGLCIPCCHIQMWWWLKYGLDLLGYSICHLHHTSASISHPQSTDHFPHHQCCWTWNTWRISLLIGQQQWTLACQTNCWVCIIQFQRNTSMKTVTKLLMICYFMSGYLWMWIYVCGNAKYVKAIICNVWNVITAIILDEKCAPAGRIWVGYVDQASSRCVLTGSIFPKHNRLAHIEQEYEMRLLFNHNLVVTHRVCELTQVIKLPIVHHRAVHKLMWWTCSCCVPHKIKIAVIILHTQRNKK